MLIDSVSKGGNLLLNVGPTARGEFDPRARGILERIEQWMHAHGRAIYGCTQSDYVAPPDCRYTQRGDRLYLHLFAWPFREIVLPGLKGKIAYAQFLHDASEVAVADDAGDGAVLTVPIQPPDVGVPVVELFLT